MCKMQEITRTVSRILHVFTPAFYTDPVKQLGTPNVHVSRKIYLILFLKQYTVSADTT